MAHYAKVENGIVTQVIVADSVVWCEETLGGEWIQTSYNTFGGVHSNGKIPLHKNYAGIGYTFDGVGFAPPQTYPSWILNQQSYLWEAPTPMPTDGKLYEWNEEDLEWVEIPVSE
jgi:hypothetical protein